MSRRPSRKHAPYRDTGSIESICAAAGSDMPSVTRPLTAPIYQNSVFEIDSLEQVDDIYEGRQDGFIYSQRRQPQCGHTRAGQWPTSRMLTTRWPLPPASAQ